VNPFCGVVFVTGAIACGVAFNFDAIDDRSRTFDTRDDFLGELLQIVRGKATVQIHGAILRIARDVTQPGVAARSKQSLGFLGLRGSGAA
jgi:hypothetical protein